MTGRPPKFTDPAELELLVELYFAERLAEDDPLTHVGLALYLGFCSRQSLYEYMKHDKFCYAIKRACAAIEDWNIKHGYKKGGAMAIFMCKNMGYTDKHEVKIDPINIIITGKDSEL